MLKDRVSQIYGILIPALLFFLSQTALAQEPESLSESLSKAASHLVGHSGVHILEYGEESLITRAWLVDRSQKSIDVQYFIWSTDNIGILAGEALLNAANRGVKVRVIVDDLLVDAEDKTLLVLNEHPNVQIKIYNPNYNVGNTALNRIFNIVRDFRGINQRMHDKVAIFDNSVSITGGRNMADEYYDHDHFYNFRDRDVLVVGDVVQDASENFEEFWSSELSVPVSNIFDHLRVTEQAVEDHYDELHAYANNPENFEPELRSLIEGHGRAFWEVVRNMDAADVEFISDHPGKNDSTVSLGGGGQTGDRLLSDVTSAKESILIQSPYLIVSDNLLDVFRELTKKGVSVRISTNSLASTDNLYAFSGYQKQRSDLLEAGIEIFEYKPNPGNHSKLLKRHHRIQNNAPIFAMHAKSMVIDGDTSYIGSFNMDPRSANLNTEVGLIIRSPEVSRELIVSIESDMAEENSWRVTKDENPDSNVSLGKRIQSRMYGLIPMDSLL